MVDRDTIIKGCENWIKYHKGEDLTLEFNAVEELLAVLKEQENMSKELTHAYVYLQKQFFEVQDKLLNEQEAVKPILKRKGRNKYYNDYVCPRCDNEVVYEQNYCSECGVKFIWEGLYHKHLDQEVDAWLEQEARKKNRLPYSPDSNVQWT